MQKLSIIIPAYNEEAALQGVLRELLDYHFSLPIELVLINDGSSDQTSVIAHSFAGDQRLIIIDQQQNRGYGASIKQGIKRASGDYIVTYDADGQFSPEHIEGMIKVARGQQLDAVFGERQGRLQNSSHWRVPGKYLIRWLVRQLIEVRVRDFNCGLRLMRREAIRPYLHLCSNRFSFSTTSMMVLVSRGYSHTFWPVQIKSRLAGTSAVRVSTGFSTILLVIRLIMLFNPLKIFFSAGLLSFLAGLIYGLRFFLIGNGLSVGSLFLLLTGVLFVSLGLMADQISELRKSQFEQ